MASIGALRKPIGERTWTLKTDMELLESLHGLKERLMKRTGEVMTQVDDLVFDVGTLEVETHNVLNRFNMLSNTQFIENVRSPAPRRPPPPPARPALTPPPPLPRSACTTTTTRSRAGSGLPRTPPPRRAR